MARSLKVLLQISRGIGSIRDEESLPWQLLGILFDVIPAERGAILLFDEDSGEIRSQVAWDRVSGPDHPVRVKREVIDRVILEKVSLLDSRVSGPSLNRQGKRIEQAGLCVPLMLKDRPIGIIYLESSSETALLEETEEVSASTTNMEWPTATSSPDWSSRCLTGMPLTNVPLWLSKSLRTNRPSLDRIRQ